MDVTPTYGPGDRLSCHDGKRNTSSDTSEDRKSETMGEIPYDAYGCVVCHVFAEES
jgi:hypothetical protein